MSEAQTATQAAATETTESLSFLDQVVAATKQTAPDQAQDLVKNLVEQALAGTVTFDKNLTRTFERAIAAIDAQAVRPAQRHHASPEVLRTRRFVARTALPGDEQRDQHEPEAARAEPAEARAVARSATCGRVRPEPVVQEDLRERVRHAGRRAVRRTDRRLRMDAASGRRRDAAPGVQCRGRGVRAVHLGSRLQHVRLRSTGPNSPGRAISPRSSRRRNTPSGAASATARTRASSAW